MRKYFSNSDANFLWYWLCDDLFESHMKSPTAWTMRRMEMISSCVEFMLLCLLVLWRTSTTLNFFRQWVLGLPFLEQAWQAWLPILHTFCINQSICSTLFSYKYMVMLDVQKCVLISLSCYFYLYWNTNLFISIHTLLFFTY